MLNNYNTKALKSKNVTNFFHLSSGKTRIFVGFFTILLLIGLAIDPKPYIASTLQGLIVFASVVLPALLPFFVLTRMLTSLQVINSFCNILSPITKFLFKAPAISSYIFFISIISGYPVGAKLTAECYEQGLISSLEAQKISTFTSNSGPMFIIGTVGVGLLFSKEAGFVILLSHILGSILNGVFYRRHFISQNSQNKVQKKPIDLDKIFDESVHYSVLSLLKVGAYIALFFTLNELLVNYSVFEFLTKLFIPIFNFLKLDLALITPIFKGIIEVTNGCFAVSNLSKNLQLSTIICTALISFGGFSVHFQSLSFLKECKINKDFYFLQKITHSIFSIIICYALIAVFHIL